MQISFLSPNPDLLSFLIYLCGSLNTKNIVYMNRKELVKRLKYMIKSVAPNSQTILYGSEARGEAKQNSDIDILILVDKDTVSPMEEDVITAPIYDLEIETGTIISPIVMTRKAWEAAKRKTVFYYNVMKDGVLL